MSLNNFAYIQRISRHIAESFMRRKPICDFAWQIDNVLPEQLLTEIDEYYDNNTAWDSVDLQEDNPRRAITWTQDVNTTHNRLYWAFQQLTPVICHIWRETVDFSSLNMWEDSEEYTIEPHVDNDELNYAIQVYVNDADPRCGTAMYLKNYRRQYEEIYRVPFIRNTGYVLKNGADSHHGMMTKGNIRRSLYVNFR